MQKRNRIVSVCLTENEMRAIQARADLELSPPGDWLRRTAISVTSGVATVGVNPNHPANKVEFPR